MGMEFFPKDHAASRLARRLRARTKGLIVPIRERALRRLSRSREEVFSRMNPGLIWGSSVGEPRLGAKPGYIEDAYLLGG